MGMKFRKSINLGGGTRLNVSRSGVGISTGVKGFRVSKNTSGRSRVTASLPGTGLSYTKEYGSSGSSGNSQPAPVHHSSSYSGGGSAPSGGGDKPPFFQRPGVIFLCLLLFAPLGIFLMWRYMPQWKTGMKVALSILFGLVFVCALVPKAGDNVADVDQPPAVRQQVEGEKTPARIQKPAADKQEAPQEPQDAAVATTGTETQPDTQTPQEPAQTPQETPQTTVQQDEPQQEQPKQEEPKQEQPVQQEEFKDEERMVYITPDGKKYHKKGCRTIKGDCTEININDAIAQGRTACKVCGG